MKSIFWGCALVLAVSFLAPGLLADQTENQQRLIEELQRQQRQVIEQQQRQFEEQQHQRRIDEINRMGEESRRNSPYQQFLNEQILDMLRK